MKFSSELLDKVRNLPRQPGVYKFKNEKNKIIYVGKAVDLRARVSSYFHSGHGQWDKVQAMVAEISDLDYLIVGSEYEALILEADLVRQLKPHYNIRLKDDKHFPFLKITISEPYPRMQVERRIHSDGSKYYGPFISTGTLRMTMQYIAQLFQIRLCNLDLDGRKFAPKPCLYYHLKQCSGPCIDAISQSEYRKLIQHAMDFFDGKKTAVRAELEQQMRSTAEKREFENAARYRDLLASLDRTLRNSREAMPVHECVDIIALAFSPTESLVLVLPIRNGCMLGEKVYRLQDALETGKQEILANFIKLYYGNPENCPDKIAVPEIPNDKVILEQWLKQVSKHKVEICQPKRGVLCKYLDGLHINANERFRSILTRESSAEFVITPGMQALQDALKLPQPPRRIEGYDIAHTGGTDTVGSMVVTTDGKPDSKSYRQFNLKHSKASDDFDALREVLSRRLKRYCNEEKWRTPPTDLIMIDGGKGQLSTAKSVFTKLLAENSDWKPMLEPIQLCSLAKRDELVYVYNNYGMFEEIAMPPGDPGLVLLIKLRDEAHRFSRKGHFKKREVKLQTTLLDKLQGIGAKRKQALIDKFGTPARVLKATLNELANTPSIGPAFARKLRLQLDNLTLPDNINVSQTTSTKFKLKKTEDKSET